jgi:hypothetical protein
MRTQLLCTFSTFDTLEETLANIANTYEVEFDIIYVLRSAEDHDAFCCTYNVKTEQIKKNTLPATISLHRKKASNTLYTINALNALISELNDGVLDKQFRINWSDYSNTILVTAYGSLKKIKTELIKKVKASDLTTEE